MWQVEKILRSDHKKFLTFLDSAFAEEPGYFRNNFCHIYQPDHASIDCLRVIRRQNRIVGALGIFPLQLKVGAAALHVAAIGGIAADPACRGQGVMTALLEETCKEIEKANYDISILWGDRERYGRYGWEKSGTRLVHDFTCQTPWSQPGKDIRKLNVTRDLELAFAAFNDFPLRAVCNREQMRLKLKRKLFQYYVSDKRTPFAYISVSNISPYRVEEMAGDLSGIENCLAWLTKKNGGNSYLQVCAANSAIGLTSRMKQLAESTHAEELGSIKIVNLNSTVRKLLPLINQNYRPLKTNAKIAIKCRSDSSSVVLKLDSQVRITPNPQGATPVLLHERKLAQLIFGWAGCHRPFNFRGQAAISHHLFPVNIYLSGPDHV